MVAVYSIRYKSKGEKTMKILQCNIEKMEKTTFYFNKKEFSLQDISYKVTGDKITCSDVLSKKQVIFTSKELQEVISQAVDRFAVSKYILNKSNLVFNRSKRIKTKDKIYNTISDNSVAVLEALLGVTYQRKDKALYKVKA
jgi:hypothetical protein